MRNGKATGSQIDTPLTRENLASFTADLARLRPGHPAGAHISNLIEQLKNYERNPVLMKPRILMTVQRIEEARQS